MQPPPCRVRRLAGFLKAAAMNVSDIIGIVTLGLAGLGTLVGAAWWMSALYSKVGHIQENTADTSSKLDTLTESVDGGFHDVRHELSRHSIDITDLKVRVTRVEDVLDTELSDD